jgi:hypothetical protein
MSVHKLKYASLDEIADAIDRQADKWMRAIERSDHDATRERALYLEREIGVREAARFIRRCEIVPKETTP